MSIVSRLSPHTEAKSSGNIWCLATAGVRPAAKSPLAVDGMKSPPPLPLTSPRIRR